MLYPISFIAALSLLILWFSYKNKESNARLFSKLFFLSLGVYGVNLFLQDATFGYKLMALSRDLMIMGGAAFFASILSDLSCVNATFCINAVRKITSRNNCLCVNISAIYSKQINRPTSGVS